MGKQLTLKEILETPFKCELGDNVFILSEKEFGTVIEKDQDDLKIRRQHNLKLGFYDSDGFDSGFRNLFTVEQAAALGFVNIPIGERCVFWRPQSEILRLGILYSELNGLFIMKTNTTGEFGFENFKLLSDALADSDFCQKWNL